MNGDIIIKRYIMINWYTVYVYTTQDKAFFRKKKLIWGIKCLFFWQQGLKYTAEGGHRPHDFINKKGKERLIHRLVFTQKMSHIIDVAPSEVALEQNWNQLTDYSQLGPMISFCWWSRTKSNVPAIAKRRSDKKSPGIFWFWKMTNFMVLNLFDFVF